MTPDIHPLRRGLAPRPLQRTRAGAGRGCLIAVAAAVLLVLVVGGGACGAYNRLVTAREGAEQKWAQVENQYRRRNELIPQLVSTVQGAADFERTTLQEVIDARASVGRVQLPALPEDPAKLQAYLAAQQQLSGALGRLFAVAEQYPTLKASEAFLTLQSQIEGTENRIAVAREDYTAAVRDYNVSVRRFPTNIMARMSGHEPLPQFTIEPGVEAVPEVEFDFERKQ